jgi:hypothetical protein
MLELSNYKDNTEQKKDNLALPDKGKIPVNRLLKCEEFKVKF